MTPIKQDQLAGDVLAWAFSGNGPKRFTQSQSDKVKQTLREVRAENYESAGKRRGRFWNLGPSWARRFA